MKKLSEVVMESVFCDCCGKEIKKGVFINPKKCERCGRDICDGCKTSFPSLNSSSSYGFPVKVCPECLELTKKYEEEVDKLKEELESFQDQIYQKMEEKRREWLEGVEDDYNPM
jgi:hypothetical protein